MFFWCLFSYPSQDLFHHLRYPFQAQQLHRNQLSDSDNPSMNLEKVDLECTDPRTSKPQEYLSTGFSLSLRTKSLIELIFRLKTMFQFLESSKLNQIQLSLKNRPLTFRRYQQMQRQKILSIFIQLDLITQGLSRVLTTLMMDLLLERQSLRKS